MTTTSIMGLDGRVALLTGAAGGVGRATAALLLAHGARLVVEDRDPAVRELADAAPDAVVALVGDVADESLAARAVATAVDTFGSLDILVNNAGRTLNKTILDTSVAEFDGLHETNARGTFVHTREALRVMQPARSGAIVNVASMVSTVALPLLSAYAASKGAIAQLTKVAALEVARDGIRVNAIAAGVIETGILDEIVEDGREALRQAGAESPIGRAARPAEIAEAIAWVASPRASYVTGALIPVDGGYTTV